jgi:hypothetical protein
MPVLFSGAAGHAIARPPHSAAVSSAPAQETLRIDRLTVNAHFVMEMGPGRALARTDAAENRALGDFLAFRK